MGLIVFNLEGKKERMNDFLQGLEQNITPPPPQKKKTLSMHYKIKLILFHYLILKFLDVFVL